MRLSKLRLAEYHYGKAAEIHPQNAVLLGCLGMVRVRHELVDCGKWLIGVFYILPRDQVEERRGDMNAALKLFNQAVGLSQENALVRYHRAKCLIAMKKYQVRDNLFSTPPDADGFSPSVAFDVAFLEI